MIRHLEPDDLAKLPRLHARVWGTQDQSMEELEALYTQLYPRLYFDHPWFDPEICSLVSSTPSGELNGLLGVACRQMRFRGTDL